MKSEEERGKKERDKRVCPQMTQIDAEQKGTKGTKGGREWAADPSSPRLPASLKTSGFAKVLP